MKLTKRIICFNLNSKKVMYKYLFIFLAFACFSISGQTTSSLEDSLSRKSFKELSDGYYKWEGTPEKSLF